MYTILHAILGYLFLLLTVRVLSRRPGGQLTPFEFVIIFLIGGIIILSTTGNDHSTTNTVCAVLTIGLMHRFVSWIKQCYPAIGAWIDGTPLVLMKNGQWQQEVMDRMRVQDTDVMASARLKGLKDLQSIKYAVLERNGSINIIKAEK
jgi:uncharacterized membrane protein YcaP (DUF421 family)